MKKLIFSSIFICLTIVIVTFCNTKVNSTETQINKNQCTYVTEIPKKRIYKNTIRLCSFNACNFGKSKSNEELQFIAKLLRNTDIICIQEVSTSTFGAQAIAKLSDELNRTGAKWYYKTTESTHESDSKERYGFLWRSNIQISKKPTVVKSLADKLEREPGKITFKINGKLIEIFSFHLVPTKKKPINEVIRVSGNDIFKTDTIQILLGDFNLSAKSIKPYFENKLGFKHQIEGKTSLKRKLSKENIYVYREYDNIYTRGNIQICFAGIVDFVPQFPNLKQARQISDHLPVFIEFTINN